MSVIIINGKLCCAKPEYINPNLNNHTIGQNSSKVFNCINTARTRQNSHRITLYNSTTITNICEINTTITTKSESFLNSITSINNRNHRQPRNFSKCI